MRALGWTLLFSFLMGCSSPSGPQKLFEFQGATMGTTYSVKFTAAPDFKTHDLKVKVDEALKEVNRQMSTYIPTSEISLVNRAKDHLPVRISDWFGTTLKVSIDLARKTKGAFDPTIGPLVNLWGFGPEKHKRVPSVESIQEAKGLVGYEKISLKKTSDNQWEVQKRFTGTAIDLSASAKGFGVDVVSKLLSEEGLKNHLVEIGGELRAQGSKLSEAWRVAIEKPQESGRSIQQVIELHDLSLATSGNYRNFFESGGKVFPHSMDQKSGRPVENRLLSVSVLHKDCVQADALATALMVMGPERAQAFSKEHSLAAFFIIGETDGGSPKTQISMTPNFKKMGRLP